MQKLTKILTDVEEYLAGYFSLLSIVNTMFYNFVQLTVALVEEIVYNTKKIVEMITNLETIA